MGACPFPGMDPFLEYHWGDFHLTFFNAIRTELIGRLVPRYLVRIEERRYPAGGVDLAAGSLDIGSMEMDDEADDDSWVWREPDIRDRTIVVRHRDSDRVVCALKLLLPEHKEPNSRAHYELAWERNRVRTTDAAWIEIDLLHAGGADPIVERLRTYSVLRMRAGTGDLDLWEFGLRDPLPTIAVPLLAPDPDVSLPLQPLFDEIYRRSRYDVSTDYSDPLPDPPLSPEDEAWVRERLAQRNV